MSKCAELDRLIDFGDPAASEAALRERFAYEKDPEVALEVRTLIGRAMGLQGNYIEALDWLRTIKSDLPPGTSIPSVRLALEQGRCYNDTHRHEEAFERFLTAYRMSEEMEEEFLAMDALHMLAIVGSSKSQIEWAEKALNRLDMVTDPDAAYWRGPILNNLGWSYFEMGEHDSALRIFQDSVEFRRQGPKIPLLVAEYSVARCLRQLGRYQEALALLERLLEENAAIGRSAPYVEEEMGECLYAIGEAEAARPHFATAYQALSADHYLARNEPDRLERLQGLSESQPEV